MRILAALMLVFAIFGQAVAQTTQCSSIPKASDRLACYDRASPPTGVSRKSKAAVGESTDQSNTVDMLAVENSKLDARLKTICRGC